MECTQININYTSETYLYVIPLFKSYLTYCARYQNILIELEQFKNWKKGKEIMKKLESDPSMNNLKIESLAVMPVRRIPRYSLLLSEYKKYNPSDLNATTAIEMLKNLSEFINVQVRKMES